MLCSGDSMVGGWLPLEFDFSQLEHIQLFAWGVLHTGWQKHLNI